MSTPPLPWDLPKPGDTPGPGDQGWTDTAVRWLYEAVPANRWRHKHLAHDPWLYAISTVTVVRGQLEQLRVEYRATVDQWAGQLPKPGGAALIRATVAEGNRLKALLGDVMAVEDALMREKLRPGVRPPS